MESSRFQIVLDLLITPRLNESRPRPRVPRKRRHIIDMLRLSVVVLIVLIYVSSATILPIPTAPQLAWQKNEIMALIHFNMATFFHNGDPGCNNSNWVNSSKPSSFAPARLNVSQWIEAPIYSHP